jgi:uncharacterized membrane protein
MSNHEDVLRQLVAAMANVRGPVAIRNREAYKATLAELAALRESEGMYQLEKRKSAQLRRDLDRQDHAVAELRARLAEVDHGHAEAVALALSQSGHIVKLEQQAERAWAALRDTRCCLHVQGHWDCAVTHARARAALAPVAEQPADARNLPAGTLVTCEYCPEPHPKDDDGTACRYPKVASQLTQDDGGVPHV